MGILRAGEGHETEHSGASVRASIAIGPIDCSGWARLSGLRSQ